MSLSGNLNALFVERTRTEEGRTKLSEAVTPYIRDHVKEASFWKALVKPGKIDKSKMWPSMDNDTLVAYFEVEPTSRAMTLNMRGQPDAEYIEGFRYQVAPFEVASPRYEKTEEELEAYTMDIKGIIRSYIGKDLGDVIDRIWLTHNASAVESLQQDAQSLTFGATYADAAAFSARNVLLNSVPEVGKVKGIDALTYTVAATDALGCDEVLNFPVQKDDLIKCQKLFSGYGDRGSRMDINYFLMSKTDMHDVASWVHADVADIVKETTIKGAKFKELLGTTIVTTGKTNILRPGNIYAFSSMEYYGGGFIKDPIKFYTDRERNVISMEAWERVGMHIGNVAGVRKLELFCGAADPLTTTTHNVAVRARFDPKAEADLPMRNNLVPENQFFPTISFS